MNTKLQEEVVDNLTNILKLKPEIESNEINGVKLKKEITKEFRKGVNIMKTEWKSDSTNTYINLDIYTGGRFKVWIHVNFQVFETTFSNIQNGDDKIFSTSIMKYYQSEMNYKRIKDIVGEIFNYQSIYNN